MIFSDLTVFYNAKKYSQMNVRYTGYAVSSTNPDDKTKIPTRYTYGSEEYSYNIENLKAALQRQYNGDDKSNGIMWMLKP